MPVLTIIWSSRSPRASCWRAWALCWSCNRALAAELADRRRTEQYQTLLRRRRRWVVYVVDADLKIREVNPTARLVFGDIPDSLGSDFERVMRILWPRSYADELVRRFRHTLETGESYFTAERAENRRIVL